MGEHCNIMLPWREHGLADGVTTLAFTACSEVTRVTAPKALNRFKRRIREITRRAKGVSIQTTIKELASYMRRRGWRRYFGFCETPVVLD